MRGRTSGIYPATKTDCQFLEAGLSDDSIVRESSSPVLRGFARTFYTLAGAVDLPLSVAADTLLLPYDLTKKNESLEQGGGGNAFEQTYRPSTAPTKARATP